MTEMPAGRKEDIVAEVVRLLEEYPDIDNWTLRQMYYRLVAREIIPNNINEYKKLSRYLVWAREEGIVDYKKFEDRARKVWGYGDHGYRDLQQFIDYKLQDFKQQWKYFSYKQWEGQTEYIEVWLEKDALARLFEQVGNRYSVYTCPSRGYPSYSYIMDAVERFKKVEHPITILYFGDYDPSGLNIAEDLISRIRRYSDGELIYLDPSDIVLDRIALNRDQIDFYDLPPAPAKRSDKRYKSFVEKTGSDDMVELDALDPPVLQDLIKQSIEDHIDADEWNKRVQRTEDAKEELRPMFENAEIELGEE